LTLEESARRVQAMRDAAAAVKPDILVLCHGGPISEPSDAQYIFDHTHGIAGFFGASSIERLAVEPAIEKQARDFKALALQTKDE
jgi:predicted TIM-barrel enzyme